MNGVDDFHNLPLCHWVGRVHEQQLPSGSPRRSTTRACLECTKRGRHRMARAPDRKAWTWSACE